MHVSRRAYARHRGISESAVRKAISAGRITVEIDGKINIEKANATWLNNTATKTQSTAKPKKNKPVKKVSPPKSQTKQTTIPELEASFVDESDETDSADVGDEEPLLNNQTTFAEARTANEILKAQTQKLKLAELRKELVNRDNAIAHVFQLARNERDAWQRWPSRIAAEMSSQLAIDQHTLHTLLEHYVRQHLSELIDIKPTFDRR